MQSFESSSSFLPLNAYFYPPETGFASVASSSTVTVPPLPPYEDSCFPNIPQQHYPSTYPNNFLPLQGSSMIASTEPVNVPSGTDEATIFPDYPQQHYPSNYYPKNFLPPQGFSMVASSTIPSSIEIINDGAWNVPRCYQPSNLPLQGFSVANYTAHPRVTPVSPSDNVRRRYSSVIPATKPSKPKTRVRNRKRLGKEDRIKSLQKDEYVMSFGETWVTCAGCRKTIKLDSRNEARYYLGFWFTHKGLCPGVEGKMVRFLSKNPCIESV